MKPTIAQQDILKKYLRKNLRYSETYAEFYDHILTALENISGIPFEDAVNQVIDNDFGGDDGMVEIEDRYRKQTIKEMQGRYLHYLADCVRFPSVILLVISAIMIYYLVKQPWFSFPYFFWSFMAIYLIPGVLNGIRYIRAGYIWANTPRSVKDDGFTWLKYIPRVLMILALAFNLLLFKEAPIDWFKNTSPVVITLILMVYIVLTLAFYRIFRHEYKINLSKI